MASKKRGDWRSVSGIWMSREQAQAELDEARRRYDAKFRMTGLPSLGYTVQVFVPRGEIQR